MKVNLGVEEADLEDDVQVDDALGHAAVAGRVAQKDDVGTVRQVLEVGRVMDGGLVLVEHVYQVALQPHGLSLRIQTIKNSHTTSSKHSFSSPEKAEEKINLN